jgi:photosystem II stability/assembly factor-like uncharacterized protein
MRIYVGRQLLAVILLFGAQWFCSAGFCAVSHPPPSDAMPLDIADIPLSPYDISVVEVRGVPQSAMILWLVPPRDPLFSGIAVVDVGLLRSLRDSGVDVRVLAPYDETESYYLVKGSPFLSKEMVADVGHVIWQSGQSYLVAVEERFRDRLGILRSEITLLRPFEASLRSLAPIASPPLPLPTYSPMESFWIDRMVNSVSEEDLFNYISSLSGEIPVNLSTGPATIMTRYMYHPDCEKAAEYLYSQFDSMGVDVAYDQFFYFPIRCIEFIGSEGYVVGNSGVIYHTEDGGNTWERQNSGTAYGLMKSSFVSPDTGWVAGTAGTLLKTTNGGSDWTHVDIGFGASLYGVEFLDANLGWICGAGGIIEKSTDGGLNWTRQWNGPPLIIWDIEFADPLNGWAVGSSGSIPQPNSRDGGQNWQSGTILHSSDGGQNWESQVGPLDESLYDVCFVDSLTGWVVGAKGTILHTSDGGDSWESQNSGVSDDRYNDLYAACFVDSLRGWVVGINGLVLFTDDGGTHWIVQQRGIAGALWGVSFINSAQGWVAGATSLLRTEDGGASWSSVGIGDVWKNVVATLEGTKSPSDVYIVCAHYDSMSDRPMVRAPGGDDNASGTSLVLEAAKILKDYGFESTIKFICFSGEEEGLYGSWYYAKSAYLRGERIKAVLNFDMIAYGTTGIYLIGNRKTSWLVDYCIAVRDSFLGEFTISRLIDDNAMWGDHASFWLTGYHALMGIELDNWTNPNYHTRHDVVKTLNMGLAADVTKLAVAWLASLAGLAETPVTIATVDVEPNTLNLKSNGKYITCYIELPPEQSVDDIGVHTVMLNSSIKAEPKPCTVGDYDADGVPDLMVKFARDRSQHVLPLGDAVEIVVSGEVGDFPFQGKDTIRVIGEREHPVLAADAAQSTAQMPGTCEFLESYPNPSNPLTRITFSIAKPGRVVLRIYDIAGRPVRTLVDGWREPQRYQVIWDGRDDKGNVIASGVYLYKLEAPGYVETKKTVLLH